MSRTSRRVSRPLIGALAAVIVVGVFVTVHKLHSARAQQGNASPASAAPPSQSPAVAVVQPPQTQPSVVQTQPAAPPVVPAASIPATQPTAGASDESSALVTQTPTAKPPGDSATTITAPARDLAGADASTKDGRPTSGDAVASISDNNVLPLTDPSRDATSNPRPDAPVRQLVDPKVAAQTGDLLGARNALNQSLIAGHLDDVEADSVKKQIEELNQNLIFSARKFPDDPWGGTYQVAGGERLATIAAKHGVTWELLARVNGVTPRKLRSGQNIKIFKGPFYAVVYKRAFKMEIYLGAPGGPGSMYITSYGVGLGKDNSTPTGLWLCKSGDKIRNPRYYPPHGGEIIAPEDPKNPLGGYWIAIEGLDGQALGKESYGIHGTIDPSSIGRMESMGCIRLKSEDISWVFDLLVDGKSKVLIKD